MAKQRKALNVLSKAAISGLVASALSTTAFAAVDAYTVKVGDDIYEYSKEDLVASYLDSTEELNAPLYEDYAAKAAEAKGAFAYHDDEKGYVSADAVNAAYLDAVEAEEEFDLDTYTESEDAEVVEVTAVKKAVVTNGKVEYETTEEETPVEGELKVESVSAITPTTVTVVLNETPEAELAASFFKIAGNTVKSVEKGSYDTIYTLTLGTSLDGKKGTLTVNEGSKDYDFTQLKINSVKALNLRQLQINFSKAIDVTGITANVDGTYTKDALLNNLYIWMTNEEDGSISKNSFFNILKSGTDLTTNWTAIVSADKKSVVVEAKGKTSAASDTLITNALGLKLNENYEVEAKDILDASGKYADVSYVQQLLVDKDRPSVSVGNTDNTITLNPSTMNLELAFSEPVQDLLATGSKAKIYIDGNEISTGITDVDYETTVEAHKLVKVDVKSLTKGTHRVAIVGALDLNGNLLSNNAQELTFKIVDPADAPAVKPVVNNVVQVADNAFKVVFNTPNVKIGSATDATKIMTIKNGAYLPQTSKYDDIDLTANDFEENDAGNAKVGAKAITRVEVAKTATVPAHTEWIVVLPATASVEANDTDAAGVLAYKGANVITRDIDLAVFDNGNVGTAATKSLTLRKDTTAPVIATNTDGSLTIAKKATATIGVKFTDAPFTTDGNGKIELPSAVKKVTVKYTDKDGVTYSEEVEPSLDTDDVTLKLNISEPKMLTTDGTSDLIPGAKYTIVLPDGVVKDADEDLAGDDSQPTTEELSNNYMLLDNAHPFVGRTVEYTVPGQTDIGFVPQTTKGLIVSGAEISASTATAGGSDSHTLATPYADRVKQQNALALKDNQIVVVFDGEVNPATVTNKNNYLLGGKVLPTGTTIEFRQLDIDNVVAGDENFALITLPDNTITLTGGQDFAVSGVANKAGNKMMPVTDVINLTDNTQPKLTKVEVKDSNKLVLTFPEKVKIVSTDMSQVATNFKITANGKVVSLLNAAVDSVNENQIVITTADNFDNNGDLNVPVTVELKLNADGNMFITDIADNKAASVTVRK